MQLHQLILRLLKIKNVNENINKNDNTPTENINNNDDTPTENINTNNGNNEEQYLIQKNDNL